MTALDWALSLRRRKGMAKFLANSSGSSQSASGLSGLHFAVAAGDVALIRKLVEEGADVNQRAKAFGRITPLMVAVFSGE